MKYYLSQFIQRQPQVRLCDVIQRAAHGAKGQMRWDKRTPYWEHPRRVAELLLTWHHEKALVLLPEFLETTICAALLHDVLEDTKLTSLDLAMMLQDDSTIKIVEILTQRRGEPRPHYFHRTRTHGIAAVIKTADRCDNLEDLLQLLLSCGEPSRREKLERWAKGYITETREQLMPILTPRYQSLIDGYLQPFKIIFPGEEIACMTSKMKELPS